MITQKNKKDKTLTLNDSLKKMKAKTSKRRKWFFTIWKMNINWGEIFAEYSDIVRFIIGQKEKAPTSGRLHWQGCIHMYNPCTMTKIRKMLGLGCGENSGDLRPQLGNNAQVRAYVHKLKTCQGERFEFGSPSQQGIRSDLEDIKRRIEKGESHYSISQDHFMSYARYSRWAKEYQGLHLKKLSKRYRQIDVEILSGPTDVGKTRKAYDKHDINDIYKINCGDGLKWFDGYEGQKILILDEFKNQAQLTRILDFLDGHQCRLEVKGGTTYANWEKIYITTNLKREEIYPNIKSHLVAPFWRRVDKFIDLYPKNEVISGNTKTEIIKKRKRRRSRSRSTGVSLSSAIVERIKKKQKIKFLDNLISDDSDSDYLPEGIR